MALLRRYSNPLIALYSGDMLRACLKSERLCLLCLSSKSFFDFFQFIDDPNFDIASDAFLTFKIALTTHKQIVFDLLSHQFDDFFARYAGGMALGMSLSRY